MNAIELTTEMTQQREYVAEYNYSEFRHQLISSGLVDVTSLFSEEIVHNLTAEMQILMKQHARRNDFLSQHTDLTPRNLNTVSEKIITENGNFIPNFYFSERTKYKLSQIAGEIVHDLPWSGERYVLNQLLNQNDTHGWHWDDYAYALVFIAEAPEYPYEGGLLECVSHTYWQKDRPDINHLVNTRKVSRYYFKPGSFYFMRSDITLHRVTPIVSNSKRMSLAMSYCSESDLAKPIDHKTVVDLYGE